MFFSGANMSTSDTKTLNLTCLTMEGGGVVELIVFDHDAWGDDDYLGSVRPLNLFFFWYKIGTKTSNLTSLTIAGDHVV